MYGFFREVYAAWLFSPGYFFSVNSTPLISAYFNNAAFKDFVSASAIAARRCSVCSNAAAKQKKLLLRPSSKFASMSCRMAMRSFLVGYEPVNAVLLYQVMVIKYPLVRNKRIALNLVPVSIFCAGEFRALTADINAALVRTAGFHRAGWVLALEAIAVAAGAARASRGVETRTQAAVDAATANGGVKFHAHLKT